MRKQYSFNELVKKYPYIRNAYKQYIRTMDKPIYKNGFPIYGYDFFGYLFKAELNTLGYNPDLDSDFDI